MNYEQYREFVAQYPLERAERDSGVPKELIRQLAHDYAKADRAQICWTLGITEHHNAADNVLALINLSLLTGHVGRYGSGLVPLRGQNNVQGGGDMGAIPNKLTGFQDIELDHDARRRFGEKYGVTIQPKKGMHLSQMFDAMDRGELTCAYVVGENPMSSEADTHHTRKLLEGLDCLIVQDIVMTQTAMAADVVLPGTASWCESEGTVTNSERRVQRVRKAIEPPDGARDDIWIITELARRLGSDWGSPTPHDLWEELRTLSPMHRGMSYEKIERLGGVQWPCPDDESEGTMFLHARFWEEDPAKRGAPAPFHLTEQDDPLDTLTIEYPIRLTTGRRLDSYNTGVASNAFSTPLRRREALHLSPEEADRLGFADDDFARVTSRRGSIIVPVRADENAPGGAGVHDPALPRPGRDQHPHARHLGPEVGHSRVQGDRDPGGEGVTRGGGRRPRATERRGGGHLVDLRLSANGAGDGGGAGGDRLGPRPARVGLGGRLAAQRGRPRRVRRPGRPRPPPPADHGAARDAGTGRLDQPGRARPHRRAAGHRPRRRLRRRLVLRALPHRAVAGRGGARLRRRGLRRQRGRAALRGDDPPVRRRGDRDRLQRRWRHLAALPVPGPVRPRLGRAGPAGGADPARRGLAPATPELLWAALTGPTSPSRPPRNWYRRCDRKSRRSRSVISNGPVARPAPTRLITGRLSTRGSAIPSRGSRVASPQDRSVSLLRRVGRVDPSSLGSYRAAGGYQMLRRAFELGPQGVVREVRDAKLMGRGGAAFPTAIKWEGVAGNPVRPHYVICNADESEPGTFKDRVLMEQDPYALIEAVTIMGYACSAAQGYIYIRGEYPLAEARLRHAIEQARVHGFLGPDVMGEGFAFDIEVRRGAGAYIAGEETALINSLEGKRAEPRNKPPFPAQSGLFGQPTAINNVETLLSVLEVLRVGGAGVRLGRHRGVDRDEAVLPVRLRPVTRPVRVRVRRHAPRRDRRGGRRPRRPGRCRRCCLAAQPACSSGRPPWTCR